MRDASIVIGLGGIGSEICAEASSMIPENAPDKNRVRFVAIDTDINSLSDLKRKGFRGATIQISENTSVGLCSEKQRSEIKEWFADNPMFTKKPMTEGAGQMRIISRLALHTAVREGHLAPLFRIIDELRQVSKEPSEQSIRIYIISSLAGGTGSGIFLPLAMYLERHVKTLFGDYDSISKGFFILPSAMKGFTDTFLEKRSLDSNSYAAIKELSAFLGAGDGETQEYKMSMELAKEGEIEAAPYESPGYECCYLFGKVNRRKLLKSSLEKVKTAVANAVYMQVCSPIRGINNSREDNMPKFLAEQAQRLQNKRLKRFGSIGCGELVYPYKALRTYYAMQWAIDTMSNQWQQYDKKFFEKDKKEREERKKGKKAEEIKRQDEYVNAIKLADQSDIFAQEIRDACVVEGQMIWDAYLGEVSKEIEETVNFIRKEREHDSVEGDGLFTRQLQDIRSKDKTKREKRKQLKDIQGLYQKIRDDMKKYVAANSKYVAERLIIYYPDREHKPYELVYWMIRGENFIHPNAARYFLYNLLHAIEKKKHDLRDREKAEESRIKSVDQYGEEKGFKKVKKREILKVADEFKICREAVYAAAGIRMQSLCMEALTDYVNMLVRSYEEFYDNYSDMLQLFEDEAYNIAYELDNPLGISSFYVCADCICRKTVFNRLKERREYLGASSELSAFIFGILQRPLKGKQVRRVFPNIKEHWIESVEKEFGNILNIDIIQAMEMEEECKTERQLDAEDIKNAVRQAREILETPMIRYVTRDETKEIQFCCFNSGLKEQKGVYKEVVQWLEEHQGIADPYYCSRYQIIFYCSVVGLEAHDILEFYHGKENSLVDDGEAFVHYEDTVKNIVLDEKGDPMLTPHIHKRWYSFLDMPDSHKGYQYKQEKIIAGMFLYAAISGKLESERLVKDDKQKTFHYINYQESSNVFPNLFQCHQYLYKYPLLLQKLLRQFEEELEEDVEHCHSIHECRLFKYMNHRNVYDILLEYADSLTESEYSPEKIQILIDSVKWPIEVCVDYFKGSQKTDDVKQKMKEINFVFQDKLKGNQQKDEILNRGMARDMYQRIYDYNSENGYQESGN